MINMIFERGYFDSKAVNESKITDSLKAIRTFSESSEYSYKPTVFLSHKHEDLKDLRGVIGMLEECGAKVYIDSMDNKMPDETSEKTAKRIKEVINYSKKFIFLATEKAIESYWCNWELGIGDILKLKNDNIAILPIKEIGESDYKYIGNEYLRIYPSITHYKAFTNYQNQFFKEGFYIQNSNNFYIQELSDWLKN